MDTVRELVEHELKDLYDAELKLVGALKEVASEVEDKDLAADLLRHRDQTHRQAERLESVFDSLGMTPGREDCEGIKGLIAEFKQFISEEKPSKRVLDVFTAGAARKVEHYEIVAYEELISLANELGLGDAVATLKENLAEERATADELDAMSKKLLIHLSQPPESATT